MQKFPGQDHPCTTAATWASAPALPSEVFCNVPPTSSEALSGWALKGHAQSHPCLIFRVQIINNFNAKKRIKLLIQPEANLFPTSVKSHPWIVIRVAAEAWLAYLPGGDPAFPP